MSHYTLNFRRSSKRWWKQITVTAGAGASDPILIDQVHSDISVAALPVSGGTALVEGTTSPHADVIAGTANWVDWDDGSVTADTQAVALGPLSGIRCTATTQDCTLEVMV